MQATSLGLTALGRLLRPERDLEALSFDDLVDLLDRLAADEGTLYRLPALRSLRDRLPAEGLDALYVELTAEEAAEAVVEAVAEAVVEAITVPEPRAEEPAAEPEPVEEPLVEAVTEPEPVIEAVVEAVVEPVVEVVTVPEPRVEEPVAEAEPVVEPEPVAVIEAEPVAEPEAAAVPQPRRPRRPRKPSITVGKPVTAYSPEELTAVVRWIDTDGEKRTDDELLRAAMKELGFARIGPRIKEALGAAVSEVRG